MKAIIRKTGSSTAGFTMIEIMIVMGILGIILAIAGPTWMFQRERARLRVCQENLFKLSAAKEQWALDNKQTTGAAPSMGDLCSSDGSLYIKAPPEGLECPSGGVYALGLIGAEPTCSIENHKLISD